MAAGTWNAWKRTKEKLGQAEINFNTGIFRITLHSAGASANLVTAGVDITRLGSVGSQIAATRGYVANGVTVSGGAWTLSGTNAIYTGPTGVVFSANGGNLGSGTIKYAVMHMSLGSGSASRLLVGYVTLSSTAFLVGDGSRLTINNGGGRFWTLS